VYGCAGLCVLAAQVCFKQNVHRHSLEFIQRQAKLFEPVPANFTSADATYLFEDKPKGEQACPIRQRSR
jgi:hypothetical protein